MPQKKNNSKQTKVSAERNGNELLNAYFLSIELENVRCFGEKQKIDFSDGNGKPRQWTIILGDNGTGKTTVLKCVLNISPEVKTGEGESLFGPRFDYFILEDFHQSRSLNNVYRFSVKGYYSAQASLSNQNSQQIGSILAIPDNDTSVITYKYGGIYELINPHNKEDYKHNSAIFAYGASRKAGLTSLSNYEEDTYKTLFDETFLLINPEEWLLQSDYATKRESKFAEKRKQQLTLIKKILVKILPDVTDVRFSERKQKEKRIPKPIVEFHTPYGWVESKDLSLGYRTSMAWMVDFASRMFDRYPESENPLAEPAIVLIDEIDLHLHPKWQRELIDYLTNLFPNTQFIVTTHSPLIVQAAAARDANIVVCRREGDHVVIDQSIEAVRGWRADQILTSDLFELPSTRDTELEKLEKQRREILSKPKLTKADEKKLKELSAELEDLRVMENPEDDKAMDIIRRAAAHLQNGKK